MNINAVPPARHVWMQLVQGAIVITRVVGKLVFLMRRFLSKTGGTETYGMRKYEICTLG
jgi:hypothetical protein